MKPMYQRKRGLLRVAAIGQVIIMMGAGCKSSSPKPSTGINDVSVSQALVGNDGPYTAPAAVTTVVNRYAALTADAAINTKVIRATLADLVYNSKALAKGDLLLIIQMAGATIRPDDDANYGEVTAYNSAGRYEFAGVDSVSGTDTINLSCRLQHDYTVAGKTQIIRVPQYTNLTIPSSASIVADPWDGTKGGVVAIHAMNTIEIQENASISVKGRGFRGGTVADGTGTNTNDVTGYVYSLPVGGGGEGGGMKGEGIAGRGATADAILGRGAPANGGGGGNWHNAAGGGGANASAAGTWTGQGVMAGSAAWGSGIEPHPNSDSPGGGRGGYSWSNLDGDALTHGPNDLTYWGGNGRRERGGLGGHPLTSTTGGADARLFMGGGGGAGDENDSHGGPGGNGGGLVFLIAGTVTGAGAIDADGDIGGPTGTTGNLDAAGGGGGGGTVVVHAGVLSGISITANGGEGGKQETNPPVAEAEGPGGGGGGGFIALSGVTPAGATAVSATADGAAGGTTTSSTLTEFPSNGATAGHAGLASESAALLMYCTDDVAPHAIIIDKPSNPTNSGSATFTFGSVEANSAVDAGDRAATFECSLDGAAFVSCPPSYIVPGPLSDGWHTLDVRVVDLSGNDAGVGGQDHYRWRVDTNAPIPRVLTGPGGSTSGGTSQSSSASFTLVATEMDSGLENVTFRCRLDNAASGFTACPTGGTATPSFTGLGEGPHTLDVRAVDDAGNVTAAADTITWHWTVHLLDAGDDSGIEDDAGDAEAVDAAVVDALVFEDASDIDGEIDAAGTVVLDASPDQATVTVDAYAAADRAPDTYVRDTSVSLSDAARDGNAEAGWGSADALTDATDAVSTDAVIPSGEDSATDTRRPQDTAVTPSPDAYVPPQDTAKPGVKDAAPKEEPLPTDGLKFMGGGFCSMNPSGHSAPGLASLFLVAAFGVLVVRRRRR